MSLIFAVNIFINTVLVRLVLKLPQESESVCRFSRSRRFRGGKKKVEKFENHNKMEENEILLSRNKCRELTRWLILLTNKDRVTYNPLIIKKRLCQGNESFQINLKKIAVKEMAKCQITFTDKQNVNKC